jgi:large repetitive protein
MGIARKLFILAKAIAAAGTRFSPAKVPETGFPLPRDSRAPGSDTTGLGVSSHLNGNAPGALFKALVVRPNRDVDVLAVPPSLATAQGLSLANGSSSIRHARGDFQPESSRGRKRGSRMGVQLLLFFALLLGAAFPALATNCSDAPYFGVIDGNIVPPPSGQIQIDMNCTIRNFPASNPLTTNFSFYQPSGDKEKYLVIFDNVVHTGNMSCNATHEHVIWFTNGSSYKIQDGCQNLLIPVEKIDKQSPAPTAVVGVPFTYTLAIPVLYDPATGTVIIDDGSDNDLHSIIITDDLNAGDADLTYLGHSVYWSGAPNVPLTQGVEYSLSGEDTGVLEFAFHGDFIIPKETQLVIEIAVVLDDTEKNTAGTQFVNTATWQFGRLIDDVFYEPLPGENGVSQPMTIVEPDLVVTKTGNETAVNIGVPVSFTIDVQNIGGGDAWNLTVLDRLPDENDAGMCAHDPRTYDPDNGFLGVRAQIVAGDGTLVKDLSLGADYEVAYDDCELSLTLRQDAGPIAHGHHLIITYESQLDADTTGDGVELTNVAGAIEWSGTDGRSGYPRRTYTRELTDGTPGVPDHEDAYTVVTGLSGYYFQKTVGNETTGASPTATAAPEDRLRYRLRIFNVDETIEGITITDRLNPDWFNLDSFEMVVHPADAIWDRPDAEGRFKVWGDPPLDVQQTEELVFEFEINLLPGLENGTVVWNQAELAADNDLSALSDDPYGPGGVRPPNDPENPPEPTRVLIQSPGPLSKENTRDSATIGERFSYRITVPADPLAGPLYDVRILDDLSNSDADLRFVSASLISGGNWTLSNTGTDTDLVIEDTITGIDIPAGGQAVIEITVELLNTATNQSGLSFSNSASYTYNRRNDDDSTETVGGGDTTDEMTVVEPDLTMTKTVINVTPGKGPTDPAAGGDTLEYTLAIVNGGTSTAYDVNITDFLPEGLALMSGSATAQLAGGDPIPLSDPDPDRDDPNTLIWGRESGDDLHVPVGGVLEVSYRVTVQEITGATISNSAWVDWTSLEEGYTGERTGEGCPDTTAPNEYCYGPTAAELGTTDTNAISKWVVHDTWEDGLSTDDDATVRVGDIISYELTLSLREGLTRNVSITDELDSGLAFVEVVSVNGVEEAPYGPGGVFTYDPILAGAVPQEGDAGTLIWTLGDIYNEVDDGTNNDFVIVYRARVQHGETEDPPHIPTTTTLGNQATLGYTYADGTPVATAPSAAVVEVRQPEIRTIQKTGNVVGPFDPETGGDGTQAAPYVVNIVGNSMEFSLEACNDGDAPAYGLVISDRLAPELDETSIGNLAVRVGDEALTGGSDFTYDEPEARGGEIRFLLNTALDPGTCVTIDYDIGFHTDIAPNQTWANEANVEQYWSLPPSDAREYVAISEVDPSGVWMTNDFIALAPSKQLVSPESGEATIGEEATYEITVPGEPVNAALSNVSVTDTLDPSLEYVAHAVETDGATVPASFERNGQELTWTIDTIPSGQQVVITLTVRVANNEATKAGDIVGNQVSYTYVDGDQTHDGGSSEPVDLRIVEPSVTVEKVVEPDTAPLAGDLLTYTLIFRAEGGDDGDIYSDAFDLSIVDILSLGLAYEPGTAHVEGTPIEPSTIGDGITTPQVLTWASEDLDVHIPEGTQITVTYQVRVLESGPGQVLSNAVTGYWTSLEGASDDERTGDDCPDGLNDYCTSATTHVTVADSTRLSKAVHSDSWDSDGSSADDATVRIGDTVTYLLSLELQEGTTRSVTISDELPEGLAFVEYTVAPSDFIYTMADEPSEGASGTLVWDFGDIVNPPSNDGTPVDTLVLEYTARVMADAGIAHVAESSLPNTATLSYLDAEGEPVELDEERMQDSAELTVLQPVVNEIRKVDLVAGRTGTGSANDPYIVDIVNDTMRFELEACNDGAAPAYGMVITDQLAWELDEGSLSEPEVRIDGALLTEGNEYSYLAPGGREGELRIELDIPIPAGQCLTVEYEIGFHNDVAANQEWSNRATVDEYWSLDDDAGQQYGPVGPAEVWMSNAADAVAPTKVLESPASAEATIGEEVTYLITVPGEPVNAALHDVIVSDTLDPSLEFVLATASMGGATWELETVENGQELSWSIETIPAGQQVEITLVARVANSAQAQAGITVSNYASYSHVEGETRMTGGTSDAADLRIVEPSVTVEKAVAPDAPPVAGDLLTYTLTFTAASGADYSDAFDLEIVDTLSPGLAYVEGSATVGGDGNAISDPDVSGDGVQTAQTLHWTVEHATMHIPEGASIEVTYQVRVLEDVGPGQVLRNTATGYWTSLEGPSEHERTGADCPDGVNDYCTSAATELHVDDNTTLSKARQSDTWSNDGEVRVGDLIDYELRIGLQKGTHNDLVLTDTLPTGMAFEDMVSADYFGEEKSAPAPATAGQTLIWDLGTVVNPADSSRDELVIVYRARVLNESALSQEPTTQTLTNSATLDYTIGGDPAAQLVAQESITVLQPFLAVTKSSNPPHGSEIAAGDLITYTVDIHNSGDAPAYDAVLLDTLPVGLRDGGVTTTSITLVNAGTSLPMMDPHYDPSTGIATWDFDSGIADAYTIPAGETLRVVYQASADAGLGAGLELTNAARVTRYYSFDNDQSPENGHPDHRQVYGPTDEASTSLTTPKAGALHKAITQETAAVGERFSYIITVPEEPEATALQAVQIVDDLAAAAADLRFVSAWLNGMELTNSGTDTYVVLGADGGIDIPANEQIEIEITVELLDTENNLTPGLTFVNTAWYGYSNGDVDFRDQDDTAGTSDPMTVAHPDLVVTKSGPESLRVGIPDNFVLDVVNVGNASAWNVTLKDRLPNPTPGGMCDAEPSIEGAVIHKADGTGVTLGADDYVVGFVPGEPSCELTITMFAPDTVLEPGDRLRVTYQVTLDVDNIDGTTLTNVAGATEWFSAPESADERHSYTRVLTDGTPGVEDHEDVHEVLVEGSVLVSQKTVFNVTTGQNGTHASPGDRLRYTITIENTSDVPLSDFRLVDELDALNETPMFVPGSLSVVSPLPPGASSDGSDPNGGAKGTGLLEVSGLEIGAEETLTIAFEATLVPVITSGTVVLNQGQIRLGDTLFGLTDDPAVPGEQNPTETLISSAPHFEVWKSSQGLGSDPDVVMAGDVLRYTLTIKNVGTENATAVSLRDHVPANTTYVAESTHLNGTPVPDPAPGVSPLQNGMLIHAPEDPTPGFLRADASETTGNVATVTFEVRVNLDVVDGTIISNQGFVNGSGEGTSGPVEERPSGDPSTPALDDPTLDIVGNVPLIRAQKTVEIHVDHGTPGIVDPEDVLRYTIRIDNLRGTPATGVRLSDLVPPHTTYLADTVTLNGQPVGRPDNGVSPLIAGILVNSPDQEAGSGILSPESFAVVRFDVQVDAGTAAGTIISNQGHVASNELPTELTDADGDPSNGHQPTVVVVGHAQYLTINKEVLVVDGGAAHAGKTLEYIVTVTNIGTMPAMDVVITDDLAPPLGDQITYVPDSATLNRSTDGISFDGSRLTADYSSVYGDMSPGDSAVLRFRAQIDPALPTGTRIGNTADVHWNTPTQTESATVWIDVGGVPGSAYVNGQVWHDANFNKTFDEGERRLAGWTVEIYRNGQRIGTVSTDEAGTYRFSGLTPNEATADTYQIRFVAPGAGMNTALLGLADSPFTNELQRISEIIVGSGSNLQNLNLPINPNGAVYDSIYRTPIAGVTLTMVNAGSLAPLPSSCFDDPAQQGQVTGPTGHYRFDINFSSSACPTGGDYLIQLEAPTNGYTAAPSRVIPPVSDQDTAPFAVPGCAGSDRDAIPATAEHCEAQASEYPPPTSVAPRTPATNYHVHVTLSNGHVPGESQLFNNHIAIDPELGDVVAITKTAALVNVSRGQHVPYTITVNNTLGTVLYELNIVDVLPPGFKYVTGSARLNGQKVEPVVNERELTWERLALGTDAQHKLELLAIVGAGVSEGDYVNRAQVLNAATGEPVSGEALATVRVVPDPTFDCTEVIGKVFDDANMNGVQDPGEQGIPGVRIVSARGLIMTTDQHGRFHLTCAAVPDEDRGSNFILKLDDRTLPSGYRVTTENPLVLRATRGKMLKFNFGATIHRVIGLGIAEDIFEPGTTEMRGQWRPRMDLLMEELQKAPSILRITYLADVEDAALVQRRIAKIKREVTGRWEKLECCRTLTIETEVFWRRGAPPDKRSRR